MATLETNAPIETPAAPGQDLELEIAALAKGLAHPIRVRILRLLAERACICGELVELLPVAQSTVSEHLRVLKQAGLIVGDIQPPRTCYCLAPGVLARLAELVKELGPASVEAQCGGLSCQGNSEGEHHE